MSGATSEPATDVSVWERLRYTPLRDAFRGRMTGRLDLRAAARSSGLPAPLIELVRDVARRTRLTRLERAEVAAELATHFADGLDAGADVETLARSFGDPARASRLIARAKRRNRPLYVRAPMVAIKLTALAALLLVLLYAAAMVRFLMGSPVPARDYAAEVTRGSAAVVEWERGWPVYRDALLSFSNAPMITSDRVPHPGEPGWRSIEEWLVANQDALATIRAGAARAGLGYVPIVGLHPEDEPLWGPVEPVAAADDGVPTYALQLPYLSEMRTLARVLTFDARRAAEAGDGVTATENLTAIIAMAEQMRETEFLIVDLVSMSIVALAIETTGEVLMRWPDVLSDGQLTELAHRFSAYAAHPQLVRLTAERRAFADFVQRIYTDDGNGDGRLTAKGLRLLEIWHGMSRQDDDPNVPVLLAGPAIGMVSASRREVMLEYDRIMDMAEAEVSVPMWQRDTSEFDQALVSHAATLVDRIRYMPIVILAPAVGKALRQGDVLRQRVDAVTVVIALELHRREHGEWPASLEELAATRLPAVPRDRFDGGPIKYALAEGAPMVYSVGADGDDDGGASPISRTGADLSWRAMEWRADPSNAPDGDWVLWPIEVSRLLDHESQKPAWRVGPDRGDR